jgi:hypothetical protein
MGTWTCEFPCVICMRFFFRFNLRFSWHNHLNY